MIFEHSRFEIWNQTQHPYKHNLSEFSYANPALPGVTNVEAAMNWMLAVLYPNTKPAVATPAALPLVGNTINDYRVVLDDGDGNAASYRWEQREGEVAASWHKVYDMDWGQDSILAAFQDNTQDLYVWRMGRTELDGAGAPIVGLYAGQTIYGGNLANQHLTLRANSGDGTGPRTGYVQVDDNFRPAVNNTFDIGSASFQFKDLFLSNSATVSTMLLASGSITDTTGNISFANENLITTGNFTGAVVKGTTSLVVEVGGQSMTLVPGLITDTTGSISFGVSNLATTGTLGAGVTTLTSGGNTLILNPTTGFITSSLGTINLDDENLLTTGNITGAFFTGTRLDVDTLRLDGNTISVTAPNTNLILQANGTGVIDVQSALTTLGITSTGVVSVTGQFNTDNIRIDGNVISSTNLNGDIQFTPNGTGNVVFSGNLLPSSDNIYSLGSGSFTLKDLFIKGVIGNGTDTIAISTILAFRSGIWRDSAQTLPAQTGDSLFYNSGLGLWLANAPDTEITHNALTGLVIGDAGHTQFAMLAGRAGGQTIQGGTAASENLILESTAHATKGFIYSKDTFLPFTTASFSGTWSGLDLGGPSNYFRDLYTKGELKGARLENFTFATLPASSAQNIGRVVYTTDLTKAYVDTGTTFKVLGVSKFVQDTVWDGTDTTKDVVVSSDITNATNAIWQLKDNANDFEVMAVTLKAISATTVRITVNVPLAAGSYRLIGLE